MKAKNTDRAGTKTVKIPTALHIPVSVLAQMPEKLRILAETMKAASKAIKADDSAFRQAHSKARTAFDDANGTANNICNSFDTLEKRLETDLIADAIKSAVMARSLTSAIYKVSGNFHNTECFQTTFEDVATLDAIVSALNECGDEIRAAVRKFGY